MVVVVVVVVVVVAVAAATAAVVSSIISNTYTGHFCVFTIINYQHIRYPGYQSQSPSPRAEQGMTPMAMVTEIVSRLKMSAGLGRFSKYLPKRGMQSGKNVHVKLLWPVRLDSACHLGRFDHTPMPPWQVGQRACHPAKKGHNIFMPRGQVRTTCMQCRQGRQDARHLGRYEQ